MNEYQYRNLYSFYGIKGCTVFVVHHPDNVSSLNYSQSGCDLTKRVKVFMEGGILTVMQEHNDTTFRLFRFQARFSNERPEQSVLLDFNENSFLKSKHIYPGTFDAVYEEDDQMFYINKTNRTQPCLDGYSSNELDREEHEFKYVNIGIRRVWRAYERFMALISFLQIGCHLPFELIDFRQGTEALRWSQRDLRSRSTLRFCEVVHPAESPRCGEC
ncbi:unnamed protein product [Toxocara canis]|uniref:Fascin domain-containing protein n=1 Tax=Toxocara canis TaxID=6265 RepID=A0A183U5V5_TOXCA|nr:unnamed protein product [Toxocara canis]